MRSWKRASTSARSSSRCDGGRLVRMIRNVTPFTARARQLRPHMTFVLAVVRLAIVLALLPSAFDWRSPLLAGIRIWALIGLIAVPLAIGSVEVWLWHRHRPRSRVAAALAAATLGVAGLAFAATAAAEARHQWMRHSVLAADPARLERLGRHVIVGYRTSNELDTLIDRRAIAGVFVAAHNVQGRTIEEIRRSIDALQEKRRAQGLAPLWIASDQEGGAVSRLSPPLARMPRLSDLVERHPDKAARDAAIRQVAGEQARALASTGVTVNFAPVVDLNRGTVNPADRLTRIHERAISTDPQIVTDVAGEYCASLWQHGVRCTLKHFPGLGRVFEDTHLASADLDTATAELASTDWIPFRALMANRDAFTMLAHVRMTALDRQHPVSFSHAVVSGLIRGAWRHDGILVTDDFCMFAVTKSPEGIGGASVAALNAGVDLILVSYDPDQYYPVMYALLQAERDGRLRTDMLRQSAERLNRAASPGQAARHGIDMLAVPIRP